MKKAYVSTIVSLILAGQSVSEVLSKLRLLMQKRGHEKLWSQVVRAAQRELSVKLLRATPTVQVAVADGVSETELKSALVLLGAEVEPRVVIDSSIVGGFTLKFKDKFLDKSYKQSLLNLYQKLTN